MKPSPQTQAAVRALMILRDIVTAYEELGNASALQAVRINHEEAREVLNALKGTRIGVYKRLKVNS